MENFIFCAFIKLDRSSNLYPSHLFLVCARVCATMDSVSLYRSKLLILILHVTLSNCATPDSSNLLGKPNFRQGSDSITWYV